MVKGKYTHKHINSSVEISQTDAGIKVLCIGNDAPSSKRLSLIETNDFAGGQVSGEAVARLLGGKGKVLALRFGNISRDRVTGLIDALKKFKDIKVVTYEMPENIVTGDNVDYADKLKNILKENPDFDLYYGMSPSFAIGVAKYFNQIKLKKKIVVYGVVPEVVELVKLGIVDTAIGLRQFLWGERLVKYINDAIKGKTIPKYDDTGTYELNKNNYTIFEKNF